MYNGAYMINFLPPGTAFQIDHKALSLQSELTRDIGAYLA